MDEEFVDMNDVYGGRDTPTSSSLNIDNGVLNRTLHRTVGYLVALIGCVVIYSFVFTWGNSADKQVNQVEQTQPTVPAVSFEAKESSGVEIVANKVKEVTGIDVQSSFDWEKEEEIATNQSAVAEFDRLLQQISRNANDNVEKLALLNSNLTALLTSEAGSKIGSDREQVAKFIGIQEAISGLSATDAASDGFVKDMTAFLERIKVAKETSYAPKPFVLQQARQILERHATKSSEIRRYSAALKNLISASSEQSPGSMLETAILDQQKQEANELAEYLAGVRQKSNDEKKERLAAAEQQRIKAEADLEVAKIEARRQESDARRLVLVAEAERKKLETEFTAAESEVRTYLSSLIADGRTNRGAATGVGPVSYSDVVGSGALVAGNDGIIAMSKWCGSNGRGWSGLNPRAKDSKVLILNDFLLRQANSESSVQFVEKAQELLKKFGPLMVEKGMLAE